MRPKSNLMHFIAALIILLLVGFFTVFFAPQLHEYSLSSYSYFVDNTYDEIGSQNMVTGIYLDYRLFDSLFEAGILFSVTAGILFMSKRDEEVR